MKYKHFIISSMLLAICCTSCNRDILPPEPDSTNYAPPPVPEVSYLNIPIKMRLFEMASLLNQQVPQELFADLKGTDIGYGGKVAMRIVRDGTIYMTSKEGDIFTNIPIKIADGLLSFEKCTTLMGVKKCVGTDKDFGAKMFIKMKTRLAVDNRWNLSSYTSPDFQWGEEPTLKVAGFSIPLGKLTNSTVKEQLGKVAPQLDEQIKNTVALRATMDKMWAQFAEATPLTDAPAPVWLQLKPTNFHISPIKSLDKDNIQIDLSIKTLINTVVGTKPAPQVLGVLPDLGFSPANRNDFALKIPVVLRYADIKNIAKQHTSGIRYPVSEGVQLEVKDLDIFPRGDKLAVMVDFISYGKKAKGKFFLLGKPVFNPERQTISLEEVDFDVKSRNVLLKSANFLLHKTLLNKLKEQMVFPIADKTAYLKTELQKTLANYKLTDNVFINGTIKDLKVNQLHIGQEVMSLYMQSNGNLECVFKK